MNPVVEVRFKGNRKEYFGWASDEALTVRDAVIVAMDRGEDLGWVSATGDLAARKCGGGCRGCSLAEAAPAPPAPERRIVRRATPDEVRLGEDLRTEEEAVRFSATERARAHDLPIKISDAEWQWDRRKLTVYFTADQRVDFRALVRDLASVFRTRIEMRQIGAREEAKRLDGVGRCGRRYCCSSWLPELMPVSLSLAKDQSLSLNPAQISGGCGRLLCCLRYEHDFYVASRKRFPKQGKVVRTSIGPERVLAVDIFREQITLRAESGAGDARVVPLAQLQAELEAGRA